MVTFYNVIAFLQDLLTRRPQPRFLNERGAAAVEYSLMAVFIAAVIVFAVAALGGKVATLYQTVCNNIPGGC